MRAVSNGGGCPARAYTTLAIEITQAGERSVQSLERRSLRTCCPCREVPSTGFLSGAEVGWFAIVPVVEIDASTPGSALYVGVLRIEIDPQAISKAKQLNATKPPLSVQVMNDYAADLTALKSYQRGFSNLTAGSAMMSSAEGVKATALLSTNPTAESQTKGHSVVKSILLGIVLVPLFAAAIVLSVFAGGNIQFGK